MNENFICTLSLRCIQRTVSQLMLHADARVFAPKSALLFPTRTKVALLSRLCVIMWQCDSDQKTRWLAARFCTSELKWAKDKVLAYNESNSVPACEQMQHKRCFCWKSAASARGRRSEWRRRDHSMRHTHFDIFADRQHNAAPPASSPRRLFHRDTKCQQGISSLCVRFAHYLCEKIDTSTLASNEFTSMWTIRTLGVFKIGHRIAIFIYGSAGFKKKIVFRTKSKCLWWNWFCFQVI